MTTTNRIGSFDDLMKELFPEPGTPMTPRARAWWDERKAIERTGKRVRVEPHDDNTGAPCREVGPAALVYDLEHHDCCGHCNDQAEAGTGEVWTGPPPKRPDGGSVLMELVARGKAIR